MLKLNVYNRNIPNSGPGERIARSENQGVQIAPASEGEELAKEKEAFAANKEATAEKVKEINRLLMRIDTLEGAKERQDNEMAKLHQRNRELMSQVLDLYPLFIFIS